jgi:carboxylesterase type B
MMNEASSTVCLTSLSKSAITKSTMLLLLNAIVFLQYALPVFAAVDLPNLGLYTSPEPTVKIDSGVIIGTTTSMPAATASVVQFLGIPFADKARRFQPPEKPKRWTRPLRTQRWRPACVQQFNAGPSKNFTETLFNGGPSRVSNERGLNSTNTTHFDSNVNSPSGPPRESEDCLFLNVYAPATPSQGRGRAVLFWLYGGSLQFGHAGQVAYDGSSFASYQDVVVVTTNYRTNGRFKQC